MQNASYAAGAEAGIVIPRGTAPAAREVECVQVLQLCQPPQTPRPHISVAQVQHFKLGELADSLECCITDPAAAAQAQTLQAWSKTSQAGQAQVINSDDVGVRIAKVKLLQVERVKECVGCEGNTSTNMGKPQDVSRWLAGYRVTPRRT